MHPILVGVGQAERTRAEAAVAAHVDLGRDLLPRLAACETTGEAVGHLARVDDAAAADGEALLLREADLDDVREDVGAVEALLALSELLLDLDLGHFAAHLAHETEQAADVAVLCRVGARHVELRLEAVLEGHRAPDLLALELALERPELLEVIHLGVELFVREADALQRHQRRLALAIEVLAHLRGGQAQDERAAEVAHGDGLAIDRGHDVLAEVRRALLLLHVVDGDDAVLDVGLLADRRDDDADLLDLRLLVGGHLRAEVGRVGGDGLLAEDVPELFAELAWGGALLLDGVPQGAGSARACAYLAVELIPLRLDVALGDVDAEALAVAEDHELLDELLEHGAGAGALALDVAERQAAGGIAEAVEGEVAPLLVLGAGLDDGHDVRRHLREGGGQPDDAAEKQRQEERGEGEAPQRAPGRGRVVVGHGIVTSPCHIRA